MSRKYVTLDGQINVRIMNYANHIVVHPFTSHHKWSESNIMDRLLIYGLLDSWLISC